MFSYLLTFLPHFVAQSSCTNDSNFLSFPTWYKYLNAAPPDCEPVIRSLTDLWLILAAVMEIVLRIGALLAIGFIIWASWRMISSQGDPNTIKEARSTIINAAIGLIITIVAAIAVNFVAGRF